MPETLGEQLVLVISVMISFMGITQYTGVLSEGRSNNGLCLAWDSNSHSTDQKHQSLSSVFLFAQSRHANNYPGLSLGL